MAPANASALFDEIYESRVTFVIDTSSSMFNKLRAVKRQIMDSLDALCSRPGTAFNLVRFGGEVSQWARATCRCTPASADAAKRWLATLRAESGTNSEAALLSAFDDDSCEAVYLVTDGLPESNATDFLDRVVRASARRPVHCAYLEGGGASDDAAVDLFYELAKRTAGSLSLARISERGGTVQRAARLYRLSRYAYRRPRSAGGSGDYDGGENGKQRSDNRRASSAGGGGGKGTPPPADEDGEPLPLTCWPVGALPVFRGYPFYRVTNAFSPHQLTLRKFPRVYVNGKQTVIRAPCVGYRWPYVDYYYPYGGAPWAWWTLGETRPATKEATRASDAESGDSERSHSDDDDGSDCDSDDDGEAAAAGATAAAHDEREPLVPETGMTASEIEAHAVRQIARHEDKQRRRERGRRRTATVRSTTGESSLDSSESDQAEVRLREIHSLETRLQRKIRELDASTAALRQRSVQDEIRAGQRKREALQQELECLQSYRRAFSSRTPERRGREMSASAAAAAQKAVSFDEGLNTRHHYNEREGTPRAADLSQAAITPRLESRPSNASWTSAGSDRRERRPPWARYWKAAL